LTSPALEIEKPLRSSTTSPLITKHVNGDGLDDLIVGAYGNDQSNKSLAGRSYVVFGKQNNTDAINQLVSYVEKHRVSTGTYLCR
jgi:hypothetical protein